MSFAVYRQRFADDRAGKLLERGKLVTGYERTVAGTLALAHARLSPAARQLLALCAWAAPEPLPERFFLAAAEHLPAELAAAAADPLDWDDVVSELLRYALATREEATSPAAAEAAAAGPALTLHRLTQRVARLRITEGEAAAGGLLAVLRAVCPEDAEHPQHWPTLAALAPHAQALETFDRVQALALDRRPLCWLLNSVAAYYRFGPALYATARALFGRALELARQAFGADDPDTLTAMNDLALTLGQQGDLSGARGLQEQV
ncbi:tetratricopeptide repeat protein, partial [Plasticicumulans sp.]|uniref:tetratricopeptide repeat protein n=1 Tax=Plasticicumulans sp. TaxID=2307179 RepID=UPI002C4B03E3